MYPIKQQQFLLLLVVVFTIIPHFVIDGSLSFFFNFKLYMLIIYYELIRGY